MCLLQCANGTVAAALSFVTSLGSRDPAHSQAGGFELPMFDWLKDGKTAPRKGMPSPRIDEAEFKSRFKAQFQDRNFASLLPELDRLADAAPP
jgi:hypothetical protein